MITAGVDAARGVVSDEPSDRRPGRSPDLLGEGYGNLAGTDEQTPLAALLAAEVDSPARWTVPGHMGGRCVGAASLSLLGERLHATDLWPDQARYAEALRASQALAATAWGAGHAWLLTTGATGGNLAWILGSVRPGSTVVVDSACHVSVLAGLSLRPDVRPVWVQRELDPVTGVPRPLRPQAVRQALLAHPGAAQVIVTSPTYSGACSPVAEIVAAARVAGAVVYVDAAWAPHGRWLSRGAEIDPMRDGADACVVSLHKTGPAVSGAAVLLAAPTAGAELVARVDRAVGDLRSTSPLLPVLVSADLARSQLVGAGRSGLAEAVELAAELARELGRVAGVTVAPRHAGHDPLKLVVDLRATGRSGYDVQAGLRERGVLVEGADLDHLYLVQPAVVPPGTAALHGACRDRLARALTTVLAGPARPAAARVRIAPGVWAAARGEQVLTPSQARELSAVRVPRSEAVGRVAAEHAAPYPPGVPVWVPGEVITEAAMQIVDDVLHARGEIHGPQDPTVQTVAVVQDVTGA